MTTKCNQRPEMTSETVRINAKYICLHLAGWRRAEAKLSLVGGSTWHTLSFHCDIMSFLVRLTQEVPLANMQSYAIKTKRIWRMTVWGRKKNIPMQDTSGHKLLLILKKRVSWALRRLVVLGLLLANQRVTENKTEKNGKKVEPSHHPLHTCSVQPTAEF